MLTLDISIHRYVSADGRRWSSPEQAEFADGKITPEEFTRRTWAREMARLEERGQVRGTEGAS